MGSLDRRRFLAATAATVAWVATGCSDGDGGTTATSGESTGERETRSTDGDTTATSRTGATVTGSSDGEQDSTRAGAPLGPEAFAALGTCVMIPEMASGPFPNLQELERSDITEGYPGRSVRLGLRVVDELCAPIPDVLVDIWHADASGDYSSYTDNGTGKDEAEGTTFLRGMQRANAEGIVEFATIYPGWYPGRALHYHVSVRTADDVLRTSQLFLPDELTAEVLTTGVYAEFGRPDTTNATDGLGGDVTSNGSLLHVEALGDGPAPPLLALLNLAAGPSAG